MTLSERKQKYFAFFGGMIITFVVNYFFGALLSSSSTILLALNFLVFFFSVIIIALIFKLQGYKWKKKHRDFSGWIMIIFAIIFSLMVDYFHN